jgi:Na+/melibiose symporter-like transporter
MNSPPPDDSNMPIQQDPPAPPAQQEDRVAYRIAVGALGLALVAFLIGAAVIAAGGKPVPTQYWASGSGIAGAIIGILAPSPKAVTPPNRTNPVTRLFGPFADAIRDLWTNRSLFILAAVFGVSVAFAIARNSAELETVAAAAGGALVGLLAPPPGNQGAG